MEEKDYFEYLRNAVDFSDNPENLAKLLGVVLEEKNNNSNSFLRKRDKFKSAQDFCHQQYQKKKKILEEIESTILQKTKNFK